MDDRTRGIVKVALDTIHDQTDLLHFALLGRLDADEYSIFESPFNEIASALNQARKALIAADSAEAAQ